MSVQNMRDFLIQRYPSESWKRRVGKMPDNQVIAIYRRINQPRS